MSHFNPIQAQRYLSGIEYPVTKEKLMEYMEEQGAPAEVVEALSHVPTAEFETPADLISGISETT